MDINIFNNTVNLLGINYTYLVKNNKLSVYKFLGMLRLTNRNLSKFDSIYKYMITIRNNVTYSRHIINFVIPTQDEVLTRYDCSLK